MFDSTCLSSKLIKIKSLCISHREIVVFVGARKFHNLDGSQGCFTGLASCRIFWLGCSFVLDHWAPHFKFVHFSICVLHFRTHTRLNTQMHTQGQEILENNDFYPKMLWSSSFTTICYSQTLRCLCLLARPLQFNDSCKRNSTFQFMMLTVCQALH